MLGTAEARRENERVHVLHEKHLFYSLEGTRYTGDADIYEYGAIKYLTNLKNHLAMNLERFMIRAVFALYPGISRKGIWAIIKFFPLTKRLLRPAFSDSAHFSFLTFFLCVFSVRGEVSIDLHLPPWYITYTSSRIFWSFHTSYRVCLVPAESDSNSAYSAGAVAARRQNGVAVPQRAST